MTKRVGNVVYIEAEEPDLCEECGAFEELRPVGPRRESLCWDCAQRYPEGLARYAEELFGNISTIETVITSVAQVDWDKTH